jgi:hypothetical protein
MKSRSQELSQFQRILIFLSLGIYVLSWFFRAFTTNSVGDEVVLGYQAAIMGGLAILSGGLMEWIIWLANPLFILSIVLKFQGNRKAKILSLMSVVIAFSFLFWKDILSSENGSRAVIESRGLGYYLWLLSFTVWASSFKGSAPVR